MATGRYPYADGLVVCGEPVFIDEVRDTVQNPIGIVEVLSDSTEKYDREDMFEQHESIPSFQDDLLVSQKKVRVEHVHRQVDGTWQRRVLGAGDRVVFESVGCAIEVDRSYLKVFGAGAAGAPVEVPRSR